MEWKQQENFPVIVREIFSFVFFFLFTVSLQQPGGFLHVIVFRIKQFVGNRDRVSIIYTTRVERS
jgi:hypothetical protein